MLNHARSRTIPKIQNSKDDLHNYDSDDNTAIKTKTSKTKVKKKNTSQSIKPRQSNEFDNINPNLSKYTPLNPNLSKYTPLNPNLSKYTPLKPDQINLSKYTPLKPDQINVDKVLQQSVENLDKFDSELYLRKNSERKPELKNRSETANTSEFQISKEPEFTDQR